MARTALQRGLTLIELAVVLALFGVMLLVAVPTLRTIMGADLKASTIELAQTLRFVQDEAVLRNMSMRIAYDLDGRKWWIEAADGPVRIFRDREAKDAFAEFMAEKAESDAQVAEDRERRRGSGPSQSELLSTLMGDDAEAGGGDAGGGMGGLLGGLFGGGGGGLGPAARGGEFQVNQFTPYSGDSDIEEHAFAPRELPQGVRFAGVWTPQGGEDEVKPLDEYEVEAMLREAPEDQQWTTMYTHVFPGRYIEDTVVYLSDDSGESIWSITVEPLTGRVEVISGKVAIPDISDRDQRQ
ncbi:MAG: prepilin-type N-terminal cleavage/methylation domain-containing protein [Proteobacteria bacterium]|nr:prepilin-type N-terminal cleavage/methylation domain-containing protein [Pseudomonadota bacterium]